MADQKASKSRPTLVLDFDGVLHSYTSGWQGAEVVGDPPVPGAIEFLRDASEHFTIAIYSSRRHQAGGRLAMKEWLSRHTFARFGTDAPWFSQIEWPDHKPSAMVTIDDRALTFTGEWPAIETLLAFKPWNKS